MSYFIQCAYDFGGLVLGALAVIAGLKGIGSMLRYVWLPDPVREGIERGGPVLGVVAVLAYLAFGFLVIFEREEHFAWVILGLTLLFVAFAWSPVYDLISGVAFRASRVCCIGDQIRVGDVEGQVVRVGTRVLVVRTRSGDEAVLYYGKIVRDALRRTQSLTGAHVHSFSVHAPTADHLADFRRLVTHATLRCPWSSVLHPPRFEPAGEGQLEISVYALHRDYAPLVESAVRNAIAAKRAPGQASPSVRGGTAAARTSVEPPPSTS
ncbi:MAG: mechanosensitive ion channel [Nannocystaceae bacterium]|nr:mechanosensitive ion channel [Nannocystaceae bacterium]